MGNGKAKGKARTTAKDKTKGEATCKGKTSRISRMGMARARKPTPVDVRARAIRKAITTVTIMPTTRMNIFRRAPARARSNGSITPCRTWLSAWSPPPA